MKKKRVLPALLAITMALTPFFGLAMEQKSDIKIPEKKLSGETARLFTSLGLEVGSVFLEIIGLEGLGKGLKDLVSTLNKLVEEAEKEDLDAQSIKKIIKLLSKTEKQSEPIRKDMKKLAKWLSRPLKLLALFVPKKVKKKEIKVRVEDEKGNLVEKTITVGQYLKNAPEYLVEISFKLNEAWQKVVSTLIGRFAKKIEELEKKEAEKKGIKYIPSIPTPVIPVQPISPGKKLPKYLKKTKEVIPADRKEPVGFDVMR